MIYPQKLGIKPDKMASYDIMTEAHICNGLIRRFGDAIINGTVVCKNVIDSEGRCVVACAEKQLRAILKRKDITSAVEIGTKFGVGSLLLAHYAYHLTTIDIFPRTEPLAVWNFYGVNPKITYAVAENNDEKIAYLKDLDFDFALIDGDHTYGGVKIDFECVKKCGRVLFHDYSYIEPIHEGVMRFVDELPKDEVEIDEPFAFWEKRDG